VDLVAVVGEDDVDEVLADVVHVALDRGEDDRALALSPSTFSMCGSRWATAVFIVSADWSTNGSCISPEPNSSPTTFMPAEEVSLMISSGGDALGQGLVEVAVEAVAVAVDDALARALLDRPAGAVLLSTASAPARPRTARAACAAGRRSVSPPTAAVGAAPVVDEVEATSRCSSGIRPAAGSWRRARWPSRARP
jgi:hypothetical protein